MKILIAEDDPVSRKLLETTLSKLGHEVVCSSHGKDAWERYQGYPAQVIVSDWMMPEMDGLELCKRVRELDNGIYSYFVLLTARTGRENYHQAMRIGVDDFLTKPFDMDELHVRLQVAERIMGFMQEIRQLKKLLPICMYCKKIRADQGYWEEIETYLHTYIKTDFSHGICPDCFQKMNNL